MDSTQSAQGACNNVVALIQESFIVCTHWFCRLLRGPVGILIVRAVKRLCQAETRGPHQKVSGNYNVIQLLAFGTFLKAMILSAAALENT